MGEKLSFAKNVATALRLAWVARKMGALLTVLALTVAASVGTAHAQVPAGMACGAIDDDAADEAAANGLIPALFLGRAATAALNLPTCSVADAATNKYNLSAASNTLKVLNNVNTDGSQGFTPGISVAYGTNITNVTLGGAAYANGTQVSLVTATAYSELVVFDFGGNTFNFAIEKPANSTVIAGFIVCLGATPTAPAITDISPATGPSEGGTSVTITGTDFCGVTSVTFDGIAGVITGNTGTELTVTTPAHAAGAVDVVVTNAGGSDTESGGFTFEGGAASTSTIAVSASPTEGGVVSGGGTFNDGSSQIVQCVANPGYNFVNWTEGGNPVSTDLSYQFTVSGDRTLVANFVVNPDDLAVDRGSEGLWVNYDDSAWLRRHPQSPEGLASGDLDGNGQDELIADRGSQGLWARYNNATWVRLHQRSPETVATGDLDGDGKDDVIADFGNRGLKARYNNAKVWTTLLNEDVEDIATGELTGNSKAELIIDRGAMGLWVLNNNSNLIRRNKKSPQNIAAGDLDGDGKDDLIADFGNKGLQVRHSITNMWTTVLNENVEDIAAGDLDGNSTEELIIDRGALGLWVLYNNSTLTRRNKNSPEEIAAGDLDGDGVDEIIADFGGTGLRAYYSSTLTWGKVRGEDVEGIVVGQFD